MRVAIFSDIHGNLEALVAVLSHIASQNCSRSFCLGDVVGYGASPRECIALIQANGIAAVMGNHDLLASTVFPPFGFNPHAAKAVIWTRSQMTKQDLLWLAQLPYTMEVPEHGITLCHAGLDNPADFGYVDTIEKAKESLEHQNTPVCFLGHTHVPTIFCSNQGGAITEHGAVDFRCDPNNRYIVNVGSIGQPRDGDPCSCYVIYDTDLRQVEFHRVRYEWKGAQAKIRKAGLPERLAQRLALGK
jgi:diadenosine tetraphosphatase ApaH/serine/threonine PP2A family protein phosphatase